MRCFLAVNFSSEFKIQLLKNIQILQQANPGLKWIKPNNIHLTLKFYGEIDKDLYIILSEHLSNIKGSSFEFKIINQIGAFPGRNNPRVLWIGVSSDTRKNLIEIYRKVETISEECGIPREKRKFSPHLTFARVPNYGNIKPEFWRICEKIDFNEKSSMIKYVHFMQSKLSQKGAEYSILNQFPLSDQ